MFLNGCIDLVVNQTYDNLEIILVWQNWIFDVFQFCYGGIWENAISG